MSRLGEFITAVRHPVKSKQLRWVVVGLVALATVINYIDRGAMGILWPEIKKEFGFSNQDYANIFGVFVLAYAFGQTILVKYLIGSEPA
jgi:ACS family hexuronate transporter-like MFS transporter